MYMKYPETNKLNSGPLPQKLREK